VDTGGVLEAMTTFELWEALERGHVLAWMRVWREGMECWTPVGEISEFAWAIAGTPAPPAEPLSTTEPPSDAITSPPLSGVLTREAPPESGPTMAPRSPAGARWIALGSAVAVAAVILAIFVSRQPAAQAPASSPGGAEPASAPLVIAPLTVADPPADEPAAHHAERGQRRLPRGGRRAYGR
jgi:hypothetical protein